MASRATRAAMQRAAARLNANKLNMSAFVASSSNTTNQIRHNTSSPAFLQAVHCARAVLSSNGAKLGSAVNSKKLASMAKRFDTSRSIATRQAQPARGLVFNSMPSRPSSRALAHAVALSLSKSFGVSGTAMRMFTTSKNTSEDNKAQEEAKNKAKSNPAAEAEEDEEVVAEAKPRRQTILKTEPDEGEMYEEEEEHGANQPWWGAILEGNDPMYPTPEAREEAEKIPVKQLQEEFGILYDAYEAKTAAEEAKVSSDAKAEEGSAETQAENPPVYDKDLDRLIAVGRRFKLAIDHDEVKIQWEEADIKRRLHILEHGTEEELYETFGDLVQNVGTASGSQDRPLFGRNIVFWFGLIVAIFGVTAFALEILAAGMRIKDDVRSIDSFKGRISTMVLPPICAMRPEVARITAQSLTPEALLRLASQDLTNEPLILFALYMISAYCQHRDLAQKVVDTPSSLETLLGFLRVTNHESIPELAAQTLLSLMATKPDMQRLVDSEEGYRYGSAVTQLLVETSSPPIQSVCLDLLQHFILSDEKFLGKYLGVAALTPDQRNDLLSHLASAASNAAEKKHSLRSVNIMRQILEVDHHPVLVVQLAIELSKLGMRDEAIKYFKLALDADRARLEPAYLLALAMVTDPAPDVAAAVSDETIEEAERILLDGLRELADMDVAVNQMHSRNMNVHEHNRRVREALRRGMKPTEDMQLLPYVIEPTSTRGLPPHVVPAYELLILLLEQQGRLADALAHAKVYTVRCFYEPIAYYTYGRLLARAGRRAEALASLRESIALDPEVPEPYIESSMIEYAEGQFDEAQVLSAKASELLEKRNELKLKELSEKAEKEKDAREKEMTWKDKILALPNYFKKDPKPTLPKPDIALYKDTLLTQAACFLKMKRFEVAMPLLSQALELEPESPRALSLMGQVNRYSKGPLEAIPYFSRVLDVYAKRIKTEKDLGEVSNSTEFFDDFPALRVDLEMIQRFTKKYSADIPDVRELEEKVSSVLNM